MSTRRRAGLAAGSLVALCAVTMLASGCGLGAGKAPGGVQLLVTRDFGAFTLRSWSAPQARGQETVMSLLARNAKVDTRYGGGFVQSIDGLAGGREGGTPVDWFYYVNGVEASKGAAGTRLHPGDRVWWDRHDWSQTDDVPAVVGSFPEPFLHGLGGKRLPVRVECTEADGEACKTVTGRLRAQGVPAAVAALGGGAGATHTLRVAVGPWRELAGEPAIGALREGPRASGVYARFRADGSALALLDVRGRVAQTLTGGAGLIAATRGGGEVPLWIVTGTNEAGVEHAASAFDTATLRDRFAVALGPSGQLGLPRTSSRSGGP